MADRGKLLAQSRPANTSAASLYSPASSVVTNITQVVVVNTSDSNDVFSLFLDHDGTTYSEATALYWEQALNANTATVIDSGWWMSDSSGNLGVQSGTGNAITYTAFGVEYQI